MLLTFQKSADIRVEPLFADGEAYMFFVDLAGKKDTVKILSDLQGAYLKSPRLQQALGAENERIVRSAYRALGGGGARQLGELMSAAQRVFDEMVCPHSPAELASPLLHEVLALESIRPHVYGGKGVGSQGDGTAQFVARSADDRDEAMRKVTEACPQMRCFPLTITSARPGRAPQPAPGGGGR